MLKLAICEDNDIQCRQIHTLSCSSLEIPVEIDTFSSATDFLNQISNEQCPYHIILMDIELGSESVSGIKLAQRINLLNPNTQIIFISQYLQYASSVYETDHIYFVYKQQMEEYLPKALSASCRKLNKLRQQYFVLIISPEITVSFDPIFFIWSENYEILKYIPNRRFTIVVKKFRFLSNN